MSGNNLELYPAMDLRDGRVVRLYQGDYSRQTTFAAAPRDLARRWQARGVRRVHVVDLDGARHGRAHNLDVMTSLAALGLRLQCGGGVRSAADIERLLAAGIDRVVIGSLAVQQPELVCGWLQKYGPEKIVLALDVRPTAGGWQPAVHGWTENTDVALEALLVRYRKAGAQHVLSTAIDRDGTLQGPALSLYKTIAKIWPEVCLQASGGVRHAADIRALADAGVAGVIVGRSLLEGRVGLAALQTAAGQGRRAAGAS
ncbi:MAG TPA: 1-(5-phosphoribosyl)-5-[(5-phosphoribosylamino)methylideneamino]imidazole-4-carboxamide isomerase [Wenzhouxiangella sp.]|nr:1-(5-phosphoribosyl)-5-[(5-phosphoribosylamino)methylideneamino]imidazole-4-carboxamide isomerase [Wenzhouxiangella sp.]